MSKYLWICAATLLLAGCGDARNPGFICMENCSHECEDGIKGDQCRAEKQRQDSDDQTKHDEAN